MEEEEVIADLIDDFLKISKPEKPLWFVICHHMTQGAAEVALVCWFDLQVGGKGQRPGELEIIPQLSKKPVPYPFGRQVFVAELHLVKNDGEFSGENCPQKLIYLIH